MTTEQKESKCPVSAKNQSGNGCPAGGGLFFSPKAKGFNDNPYPHYDRLRNEDPVHKSPLGVWFVGKYEHVRGILKDKRFSVQDVPGQLKRKSKLLSKMKISDGQPVNLDALIANSEHWFAFLEAPDHTRLRGLVTKAFAKHSSEKLRPYIRECAESIMKEHAPKGEMDLMVDFASVIPQRVIAHLLGIPSADYPKLVHWAEVIGRIFDPLVSLEEYADLNKYSVEFMDYLRLLIQERTERPQDDLISALIEAKDEQGKLTEDELVSVIIIVFGAGEETVVNLIGNGTLALINNPEKRQWLIDNPDDMATAVDELLRYDAPLQMTSRTALEDVELDGKLIKKGDQVYISLGSANRDPLRYEDSDQLELERTKNHHMSFGDGHHICVGAQLARVEGQEAFSALLKYAPDMKLVSDELHWRDHTVLRGMRSLPVKFTPKQIEECDSAPVEKVSVSELCAEEV